MTASCAIATTVPARAGAVLERGREDPRRGYVIYGRIGVVAPPVEDDGAVRCAVCGRAWDAPEQDEAEWLTVEVTGGLSDDPDWYPSFCGRAHASVWFGRPLPPPEYLPAPARNESRGNGWGFAVFGGVCAVLLVVGAIAVVRWVLSLS
jgi:hypothetical protein